MSEFQRAVEVLKNDLLTSANTALKTFHAATGVSPKDVRFEIADITNSFGRPPSPSYLVVDVTVRFEF